MGWAEIMGVSVAISGFSGKSRDFQCVLICFSAASLYFGLKTLPDYVSE